MPNDLSSYAVSEKISRGRKFPEKPHPYRSDFERDRDRIIHCSAFRRLEGKTQVFTPGLDDFYRSRLTHSIEVAQIGRTIAKELHLNESLTEAICLAHDLGHPPFGHAGEKILNELMEPFGRFEHNRQTLRIVDLLEHPYPDFMGLNLLYETRLGLAKHKSPYDKPQDNIFGESNCSLEGQIAEIADRIAYNCHDLEDGLRAGLIKSEQLKTIKIVQLARSAINAETIKDWIIRWTRTAKTTIDLMVGDCLETSKNALLKANIKTISDIYDSNDNMIILSVNRSSELVELEEFLMANFYMHPDLIQTTGQIRNWLEELFQRLCREPDQMPGYFQHFIHEQGLERTVCDYIAGMTDRYCLKMIGET